MTEQPLTVWTVTCADGKVEVVEATWSFNNDGDLVFRKGVKGDTEVVAMFSRGHWARCVKEPRQ